jgi:hypothetical protein
MKSEKKFDLMIKNNLNLNFDLMKFDLMTLSQSYLLLYNYLCTDTFQPKLSLILWLPVYKFNFAFWISEKCKEYLQQKVICLFLTKTLEQKWVFTFTFFCFDMLFEESVT